MDTDERRQSPSVSEGGVFPRVQAGSQSPIVFASSTKAHRNYGGCFEAETSLT